MNKLKLVVLTVSALVCLTCGPGSSESGWTTDGRLAFNTGWTFFLGDDTAARMPDYDDSGWRKLNLPHDWSIEGEFNADHPAGNAGGALPGGIGWYRKHFSAPDDLDGGRLYIDFDGVYERSEVWINGHYLGMRPYGYIAFRYDLTPYLNEEPDANVIAVRVDNSAQPNSRWYSGSGIYRNVHLVKRHNIGVAHWGAFVTTPEISNQRAVVNQETTVENLTGAPQDVQVTLTVLDADDVVVASAEQSMTVVDRSTVVNMQVDVDRPRLWSVSDPYRYRIITAIKAGDQVLDTHIEHFGVRYFHFEVAGGFSLNGQPMDLHGVCMHHDLGALGAAVNRRAMERQLEILQAMGVNAIRISHNPPASDFLDLCDEMGFLVIDEAFDVWRKRKNRFDYHVVFDEWHERDLRDLVKRDRNHPSVIMWSIGNEIREQFDSTGIPITQALVDIVKSVDTTRPVTAALTETAYEKNFIAQAEALDVLGFNYKYADYPLLPKNFPGYPLLASETTSALQTRGHYDLGQDTLRFWPAHGKQKYVEDGNPDYTVSAYDHVAAFWGTRHETAWTAVKQADYLAGIFVWTGFDYLGEPVPYPFPARSSYYGIVDLAGFPKDVYYMYQSEWTDKDVLHVFPHWNWSDGDTVAVWSYYNNADAVELFLNGRSLGRKSKIGDALHVSWDVPFESGTLTAKSWRSGELVNEEIIHTAGAPARVRLTADRDVIAADGKDLSFVTVDVLDTAGNIVPYADNAIRFHIAGAGTIAGTDNGYQADLTSFLSHTRNVHKGKGLVIVRATDKKGQITLEAKAEGLQTASIELVVE